MNPAPLKTQWRNALNRPARTSKLNPFVISKVPTGEFRVAPRLTAMLNHPGLTGAPAVGLAKVAENKAYYTANKSDARTSAADMVKNYRKYKTFGAKLAALNARLTELGK